MIVYPFLGIIHPNDKFCSVQNFIISQLLNKLHTPANDIMYMTEHNNIQMKNNSMYKLL